MKRKLMFVVLAVVVAIGVFSAVRHAGIGKSRPVPKMTSQKEFGDALNDFQKRVTLDAYIADGDRDEKWDAEAIKFLKFFLEWESRDFKPYPGMMQGQEIKKLQDKLCTDPVVLTCLGITKIRLNGDLSTADYCFNRALKKFETGRYNSARAHYIPVYRWQVLRYTEGGNYPLRDGLKKESAELIIRSLRDGSYERGDSRYILATMAPKEADLFSDEQNNAADETTTYNLIGDRIKDDRRIDEYVRLVTIGRVESYRGGMEGSAGQASAEVRKKLYFHIDKATKYLEKAYELYPKYPEAPAEMMYVSMWAECPEGPEKWFWRTFQAQVDFLPAYTALRKIYTPMWGGEPYRIADTACKLAECTRYDTDGPLYASEVMMYAVHIAQCLVEGDDGYKLALKIARQPECQAAMKKVYEGYEEHAPKEQKVRYRVTGIGMACMQARWEDAQKSLDLLEPIIDTALAQQFEATYNRSYSDAQRNCVVETTPYKQELLKAYKLYEKNKLHESAAAYKKLKDKPHKHKGDRIYFESSYNYIVRLIALDKGEWIALAPNGENAQEWKNVKGKAEFTSTGLKYTNRKALSSCDTFCGQPCGKRWQIEFDIKQGKRGSDVMLVFNASSQSMQEYSFNPFLAVNRNGDVTAFLIKPMRRFSGTAAMTGSDRFSVKKFDDKLQVEVNGKKVLTATHASINNSAGESIGFHCGPFSENESLEINNIRLRKLTAKML